MREVYRRGIPIEACETLSNAARVLGGADNLLHNHKWRGSAGFPNPVARFGSCTLYVFAELEAFYNSILWRQADKSIKELVDGGDAA